MGSTCFHQRLLDASEDCYQTYKFPLAEEIRQVIGLLSLFSTLT